METERKREAEERVARQRKREEDLRRWRDEQERDKELKFQREQEEKQKAEESKEQYLQFVSPCLAERILLLLVLTNCGFTY